MVRLEDTTVLACGAFFLVTEAMDDSHAGF